jgi:hypothetical protein
MGITKIRIDNVAAAKGQTVSVPVWVTSQGTEAAIGMAVKFDSSKLANPRAQLPSGQFLNQDEGYINPNINGYVYVISDGLTPLFPPSPPERLWLNLIFDVLPSADSGVAILEVSKLPVTAAGISSVSSVYAIALAAEWANGSVAINVPPVTNPPIYRILSSISNTQNYPIPSTGGGGYLVPESGRTIINNAPFINTSTSLHSSPNTLAIPESIKTFLDQEIIQGVPNKLLLAGIAAVALYFASKK